MPDILAATQCDNCPAVTRVVETQQGDHFCVDCLVRLVGNGSLVVYWDGDEPSASCNECGYDGTLYCEDCNRYCVVCGDSRALYCDAYCAINDGCDVPEDVYSSCAHCGDERAYYCGTNCAYNDTRDAICDCGRNAQLLCDTCSDRADDPPGLVAIKLAHVVAAESIQGVDGDIVNIDGITFDFDL